MAKKNEVATTDATSETNGQEDRKAELRAMFENVESLYAEMAAAEEDLARQREEVLAEYRQRIHDAVAPMAEINAVWKVKGVEHKIRKFRGSDLLAMTGFRPATPKAERPSTAVEL